MALRGGAKIALAMLIGVAGVAALVLGYGWWRASRHAAVTIRVDDLALRTSTQPYGAPRGVAITLRDDAGAVLATGRSVEPLGYIALAHPDPAIGTCEAVPPALRRDDYPACHEQQARWAATWAGRARSADVAVGGCTIRDAPLAVWHSNSEWLLWWVPLPHVGGLPHRYFDLSVAVDSAACTAAKR